MMKSFLALVLILRRFLRGKKSYQSYYILDKFYYILKCFDIPRKFLGSLQMSFVITIDPRNPKRVIHALEICYMTGKTYTSFRTQQKKPRPFRILKIGLTRNREELYDRINCRVELMIEEGLVEEAQSIYPLRHLNALNTVGYKELFKYFDHEWTIDFAIEKIKQNSRIYSRKQMTWFKRDEELRWFHPEQEEEIINHLKGIIG